MLSYCRKPFLPRKIGDYLLRRMESKANVREDAKDNVELLRLAIRELIEEKEKPSASEEEEEQRRVPLSRLLSKLESMKDDTIDQPEGSTEQKAVTSSGAVEAGIQDENGDCERAKMGMDEIVKELRVIRRQNTITNWLLSVLIMVTAVWQLSEVSLLMMVKDTLKNPFKAVKDFITGPLRNNWNESDAGKFTLSPNQNQMEAPQLNPFRVPELPHVSIPPLGLNGRDDDEKK